MSALLQAARASDMFDACIQGILIGLIYCMPDDADAEVPEHVTELHLFQIHLLCEAHGWYDRLKRRELGLGLFMILLSDLHSELRKRARSIVDEFAFDLRYVTVTLIEGLAVLKPKSAEWFARRILDAWPKEHMDRLRVFDLSLACKDGGPALALAGLMDSMSPGQELVFVVPNDVIYAGKQQPEHILMLVRWIVEARGLADPRRAEIAVRIHLAVGFMLKVGSRVLEDLGRHPEVVAAGVRLTVDGVVVPGDGLRPLPGEALGQFKVPDTIDPPELVDDLLDALDVRLPVYRNAATMARIDAFLASWARA